MLIASFTSWHGWGWQGWPALVSLGTLALAAATAGLAWYTRNAVREGKQQIDISKHELEVLEKQTEALQQEAEAVREQVGAAHAQAEATKRQAELSASSLEASVRPILGGVPPGFDPEREEITYLNGPTVNVERGRVHYQEGDDIVYCSVPLRNVGAGVAFVKNVTLLTGRSPYDGRISNPVIPPHEIARVRFTLPLKDQMGHHTDANAITAAGRGLAQFTVYVVYTAASRDLVTASSVTVAQLPDGTFLVTGNEIYDGEAEQHLIASSANVG